MSDKPVIRVIEIRQASNGWVITTHEKDFSRNEGYGNPTDYATYVAESPESATNIVKRLMKEEKWNQSVPLPSVRRV